MTAAEKTRLLAERAMGWKFKEFKPESGGCRFSFELILSGYDPMWSDVWQPITNLAHAGEVLEAMGARGWTYIARNVSGMHMVGIAKGERSVRCFAPTLSAAICHAALLAEGVKEEEL